MKTKPLSLKQAYELLNSDILQHVRETKRTLKQELIAIIKDHNLQVEAYNARIEQLDRCLNTIELHLLGKKTRKKKQ